MMGSLSRNIFPFCWLVFPNRVVRKHAYAKLDFARAQTHTHTHTHTHIYPQCFCSTATSRFIISSSLRSLRCMLLTRRVQHRQQQQRQRQRQHLDIRQRTHYGVAASTRPLGNGVTILTRTDRQFSASVLSHTPSTGIDHQVVATPGHQSSDHTDSNLSGSSRGSPRLAT